MVELCRRLDGIPLALELAAVRLGSLSLDQLNQGLVTELSGLGEGNRGAEARQQTLEATIGWSYRLLDAQERLLWARLSVFAGGFGAGAATEVCCDQRLPAHQIVSVLGALVDKSIVNRQFAGGSARYGMLETLRQYGQQRLRELGEDLATQKRHLDWICTLGKSIDAWDDMQVEAFACMSDERDNVWAALDFCSREPDEVAAGATAAHDMMPFWECRGPFNDVRRVLTSLADGAPPHSLARAWLLWVAAVMAHRENDYTACAAMCEASRQI